MDGYARRWMLRPRTNKCLEEGHDPKGRAQDPRFSWGYGAEPRAIRESQNTQPPGLRFRTVMAEGGTQMNFYCE
jgi:hypothetical protein